MIPRPRPHPRLGETNCHEANKIENNIFKMIFMFLLFIKKTKWSQTGPSMVPRPLTIPI